MEQIPTFSTELIEQLDKSHKGNVGELSPGIKERELWMLIGVRRLIDSLKYRVSVSKDIERDLMKGKILKP